MKSTVTEASSAKKRKVLYNMEVEESEVVGGMEVGEGMGDNGAGGAFKSDENKGAQFKDLVGMSKVIDQVKQEVMFPFFHPEILRELRVEPMTGILLYGPPGCGKTMLAHAIANEAKAPFYDISATKLVSGVLGGPDENIRELFSEANRTAPSIVFIDEIDAIASEKENFQRGTEELRVFVQLMKCIDESYQLSCSKISESSDTKCGCVLIVGATNRLYSIDPALRKVGRLDLQIGLDYPDEVARNQILAKFTSNVKVDGAVDLKIVARSTAGFVGADLAALVNKARNAAVERIIGERKDLPSSEYGEKWRREVEKKLIITIADFEKAAKMVQPPVREGLSVLPNVKWDDVGGLHSLKQRLNTYIVRRIKNPEVYEHFGVDLQTGILLYGPPGCGKALVAKAVANEAGANFIHIKGSELLKRYAGQSDLAVRSLQTTFRCARICSPCIIFFEEVDVLSTTDPDKERARVAFRLYCRLLTEFDELKEGVYIMGATNSIEAMEESVLKYGRFGDRFYVPLPSPEERGLILTALAQRKKIHAMVDLMALGRGSCLENFSGADLSELMNEAAIVASKECSADSPPIINDEHFRLALEKISPSISEEEKQHYKSVSECFKFK